MLKKLLSILLVLSMLMSVSLFLFSCDDGSDTPDTPDTPETPEDPEDPETPEDPENPENPDGTVTYTITILDSDGLPVPGARVQICTSSSCTPIMTKTDANGSVSVNKEPDTYQAKIMSLPSGYAEIEAGAYFDFDSNNSTVIVVSKTAE